MEWKVDFGKKKKNMALKIFVEGWGGGVCVLFISCGAGIPLLGLGLMDVGGGLNFAGGLSLGRMVCFAWGGGESRKESLRGGLDLKGCGIHFD